MKAFFVWLWARWLVGVVFIPNGVQLYLGPAGLTVYWGRDEWTR